MFAKIDEHLLAGGTKRLDILVNNAGVGAEGDVETLREADFDRVFNTNVKALLFVTPNAVPRLVRGGRIINISSMVRSAEHTSDLQSLMRISYAVFCLQKHINLSYYTN